MCVDSLTTRLRRCASPAYHCRSFVARPEAVCRAGARRETSMFLTWILLFITSVILSQDLVRGGATVKTAQQRLRGLIFRAAGIPRNMTTVAHKMAAGGYATHMAGIWFVRSHSLLTRTAETMLALLQGLWNGYP